MIAIVSKVAVPAVLAVLTMWRLAAVWGYPAAMSVDSIRRPSDPAIKLELREAMSFQWKRPLFSVAPPSKPDPALVPALALPSQGQPRLAGIIVNGDGGVALLQLDGRLVRAHRGRTVGSWTILRVEPRSLLVEQGGETRILHLDQK